MALEENNNNTTGNFNYETRPPPPLRPVNANTLTEKQVVIAEEFPMLLNKSKEELEDLLNNEVVFDSFLETVEQIQKTLTQEEDLNQLYKKVQDEENELKELYDAYKEKIKTQQEVLQRFSLPLLLTKLKLEVQQSDELSEQIANSFLDGEIEYDHFVKHFREVRKVYHLRNAKVERIALNPSILGTHF
nr:411_t:CDS:2 [Entrophospora candida]